MRGAYHLRISPLTLPSLAGILVGLLLAGPAQAQAGKVAFFKGDSVVLVVPVALTTTRYTGLSGTNTKWDIEARSQGGVIEIFDHDSSDWRRDWRTIGFPNAKPFRISNVKTVKQEAGRLFEVTLQVSAGYDFRVFAPLDQPEVLSVILAPARAADSVAAIAYDSLGAKFFVGPLAGFTPAERLLLLKFAHLTANGTTIGHEIFKGVTYLEIGLPSDGNTWNDLRVTRTERIGKIISEQLALLKAFAKIAVSHSAIGGVKLSQLSRHGTAPGYRDVTSDQVLAYFPIDELLNFADADITSQQLVDASIIVVNGDRVQVDLSKQ